MTPAVSHSSSVSPLDADTRELISLAVVIAVGDETAIRSAMVRASASGVSADWVEETILQSYLFVGFPRALNAMRAWRQTSGRVAPRGDADAESHSAADWRARGERTCAHVYGEFYERLRVNIRALHPALDELMIDEGYGRVLGRPALDLKRRELCVMAVCAVTEQDRQLHSHLHGARHAGASAAEVEGALALVSPHLDAEVNARLTRLWARVKAVT